MDAQPLSPHAYASALLKLEPKYATQTLQQRFRDASALSEELADYFAARRSLEASHARALAKLSRRPFFAQRDSAPESVRPILDALIRELEALAQVHLSKERSIQRYEQQIRQAPSTGAWAELPAFQDRLKDRMRELNLLDVSMERESHKLDSSSEQAQQSAAHRVANMQRDLDKATSQWRSDASPAFQLAQRADVERLTAIKEVVAQFETTAADSANQVARTAELALQAALAFDVEEEITTFAQTKAAEKNPRPAPPSHSANSQHPPSSLAAGAPLPPSQALASARGESYSSDRRESEAAASLRSGSSDHQGGGGGLRGALGRLGLRNSHHKDDGSDPVQPTGSSGSIMRRGKALLGSRRSSKFIPTRARSPSADPDLTHVPAPIREDSPLSSEGRGEAPTTDLLSDDLVSSPVNSHASPQGPDHAASPSHIPPLTPLSAGVGAGNAGSASPTHHQRSPDYLGTPPTFAKPDDDEALQSMRGTLAAPRPNARRGSSSRRAPPPPKPTSQKQTENPFGAHAETTAIAPALSSTPSLLNPNALQVNVIEKVNVYFTGSAIGRHLVVGEIEAQLNRSMLPPTPPSSVIIRLDQAGELERIVPNPTYLQERTSEGEYVLNIEALSAQNKAVPLAKYQVHVDPSRQASYAPLQLQAQWRVAEGHMDLMLRYRFQGKAGVQLSDVVLQTILPSDSAVEAMQAIPEGQWDPSSHTARWELDPATLASLEGGVIRSRWHGASGAPQRVQATWTASSSLTEVGVSMVQGSQVEALPVGRSAQAGTYVAA